MEDNDDKKYTTELYKYWFSYNGRGGFCSLTPWLEAGKISIDVGSLKESNGKTQLEGHTQLWCNTLDLYAFLAAVANDTAPRYYPAQPKAGNGMDNPECFIYYGGGMMDNKVVSRILKIHYWQDKNGTATPDAFAWKTGHYQGTRNATGAIMPDMSKGISQNLIKIPRLEMVKMYHRLHFTIQAHATAQAVAGKDWWDVKERA